MSAQHTPGPWRVEISPVRGALCVVSDDAWICGELENQPDELGDAEAQANARLIAAAPDLLDAAIKALTYIGKQRQPDIEGVEAYEVLDAALAKAQARKGEP